MDIKIIILIITFVIIIITILSILLIRRYNHKKLLKKVNNLDILRNEILSIPLLNEIDKIHNLSKGEHLQVLMI